MLRQRQRAQQRGALCFTPRADQAEVKKVRVCNGIFLYGRPLSLKGRARRAERGKQHLGRHPLHAELALLACSALASFLAVHIGNIGVQHAARRDSSLETVADHKARAVGIGEENDAARLALDSGKDKLWLMDLWNMRSDYPARLLLDAARKTTHEWCANSLALCQKLDRRMKSEKGIDREGELKLLLMQLAQRA